MLFLYDFTQILLSLICYFTIMLYNVHCKHCNNSVKLLSGSAESIRNLVEKYDGGTEYYEKDGWFVLDIMMRKSV